ncbi:hypothetical protein UFOVP1419_10 [uncultured Caudovirales phage]|uniref:Uncharacterized protein n=1 Tax=uncultured Caudovirales phage TaxID=2100421 RepID=A0A6J5SCW8_9CAUD|nr:hypothetical protein UFOVP1419_10 [uncultured Caudovirales phage]
MAMTNIQKENRAEYVADLRSLGIPDEAIREDLKLRPVVFGSEEVDDVGAAC